VTEAPVRAGSGAGPTTEAGPLGHVDPVVAGAPPSPLSTASSAPIVRPSVGSAAATVGIGLFGLVATLVVLGSLAQGVHAQEVFALDVWATPFLHDIASPGLDWLMNRLSDIGSTLVIIPLSSSFRANATVPSSSCWLSALGRSSSTGP
jgi:hypothetical protein